MKNKEISRFDDKDAHSMSASHTLNEIQQIRLCFPQIQQKIAGCPLIYLDSAATTLKPSSVINAISQHYQTSVANVHRSSHSLGQQATLAFETVRQQMADFINAQCNEIIWTSGATEAINLVAFGFIAQQIIKGDEILISALEHHANIVPWQQVTKARGAILKIIPLTSNAELDMAAFKALCNSKTKLVAITGLSNATGYTPPLIDIITYAKQQGAFTLVDAAQLSMHGAVDVKKLDCDFLVCSGHKMYGPDGIGVLYGKFALLDQIKPQRFGGEMIAKVSFEESSFAPLPSRLEAGTPNITGVIGLGAAISFMERINWSAARAHEQKLIKTVKAALQKIDEVNIIGNYEHTGILSFTLNNIHHQDIAILLDEQGVALRVGQHCAMPLMTSLGHAGLIRVSVAVYNNEQDITLFIDALNTAIIQLSPSKKNTLSLECRNNSALNDIIQLFETAHSWDEKYRQIMLLGKKQASLEALERNKDNEILACESKVWLHHELRHGISASNNYHYFIIDSDARIIKGLASVLLAAFNGKTSQEIQAFDHVQLFKRLGLSRHLSQSRGNGLRAIVNKIKTLAL